MSEYARRNLACQSWHRTPDGYQSWSGMSNGYTTRPFCSGEAGHTGDHGTTIEPVSGGDSSVMLWENTLGIPSWLVTTLHHGLDMLADRSRSRSDGEAINHLHDMLEEVRKDA